MTAFRSNFKSAVPVFVLTVAIFILTKNPLTGPFKLQLLLLSLIILVGQGYYLKSKSVMFMQSRFFIYLIVTFILSLVGSTGWFFSPFFFTLYLLTIMLAFVFPLAISTGFVLTLVALFSFNIGEVDLVYDYLVVLSLLTTIPLSAYLRKEYLRLREAEKDILVLKQERQSYKNKVEEMLSNVVNSFAANLRQPINDIKQIAYYSDHLKGEKKVEQTRNEIIACSEEAIKMLNDFEAQATGKKLLSSPKLN